LDQPDQRELPPAAALLRLVNGYRVSQAIYVATALGIADLLAGGPQSSDELAAGTGSHPGAMYRLLRALAAVGVFHEASGRRFTLTPLSHCLRSDAPEPVGPTAISTMSPPMWQAWGALLHGVRTGENAFRQVHGVDVWTYRERHPEASAVFDRAMTATMRRVTAAVLAAYDFSRFGTVVDVGGGQGALLAAILRAHPTVRGVLFDQPHVVGRGEDVVRIAGVAGRCDVVGGSFFERVPDGGDAHVLRWIIHDWPDADATAILRNCRRAIGPQGRLLVIEQEIEPPNAGAPAKLADLQMLVGAGGRERTLEEYAALFAAAGFRLVGATSTRAGESIVEGIPA
jgi:O-methyltransferase/methyltransferase family protein